MNQFDPLEVSYPAGTVFFREGERGDVGYFIESGEIRVWIERDGKKVTLATLGEGELFGELSAIDQSLRSASTTAMTDCVLVEFKHHQIINRISAMDPVMQRLVQTLVERIRSTNSQITKAFGTGDSPRYSTGKRAADLKCHLVNLKRETALRRAIEQNELQLYYQPIVNLQNMKLAGFEGLIRWQHPELGMIPPDEFIPLAEESGLISEITKFVLERMGATADEFQLAALNNIHNVDPLFLTINVSARDIVDPEFAGMVKDQISKTHCLPKLLKLEVTESSLIKNPQLAAETLREISEAGVGIAVDDFGTGHSNLSSLIDHPMSTLKIDRSFITNKLEQGNNKKVVSMILKLAIELEADVVAEGIETEKELEVLRQLNCRYGQGYLFAKAMPIGDALAFVRNWQVDCTQTDRVETAIAKYA